MNKKEKTSKTIDISIITPVFNRKTELIRAFNSVKKQKGFTFEYIIIDDGSTEDLTPSIKKMKDDAQFDVSYYKKKNGGVHTARNLGIEKARGEYIYFLDSDDELLDGSLVKMLNAWQYLKSINSDSYFEVKGRCVDEKNNEIGPEFPENINLLCSKKRNKIYKKMKAEHTGLRKASILKENHWPEPENVTFVSENILWEKLREKYDSFFINDFIRVYHTETQTSYSKPIKKIQTIKNNYWNYTYYLSNNRIYHLSIWRYFKLIIASTCFAIILRSKKCVFNNSNKQSLLTKLLMFVLYPISFLLSFWYRKKIVF